MAHTTHPRTLVTDEALAQATARKLGGLAAQYLPGGELANRHERFIPVRIKHLLFWVDTLENTETVEAEFGTPEAAQAALDALLNAPGDQDYADFDV